VPARSRTVRLLGGEIEFTTPALVPSLSSKAIGPLPRKHGQAQPEEVACSLVHSDTLIQGIDEALLVSAYDIKHRLLTDAKSFGRGFQKSRYAQPNLLIIDSGWYEKNVGPRGGQFVFDVGKALDWEEEDYVATIDALDNDTRAVVVGWDFGGHSYADQIARAQAFFAARPRFASTILLKPPPRTLAHNLDRLSDEDAANLRAFDVVGVTEKDLGDKVLDALLTLARLREKLDHAEVTAPIHIFGGLDPLYTPLYFAVGGEIFDGLGWLRYAYRDGMTYHRDSATLLDLASVGKRWSQAVTTTWVRNLDELAQLGDELRMFVHNDGDWTKLRVGPVLEPIYARFEARRGKAHV
jgi:hypothetical protein